MNFQQYTVDTIREAFAEFFRNAKSVPVDKIEWSPLDQGRSVLSLAQEIARTPVWAYDFISKMETPAHNEEEFAKEKEIMSQWTSLEACEAEANTQLERLFELLQSIPEERLSETVWLPYDGGRDFTMKELFEYPRWNSNWHSGQVAYIQTLLGDRDMH